VRRIEFQEKVGSDLPEFSLINHRMQSGLRQAGQESCRCGALIVLRDAGAFVEHVVAPVNCIIVPLIIEKCRRAVN